jgi:hypothetical protein
MSTKEKVQVAIAQAKLNQRVFRDLKMTFERMLPTLSPKEAEEFLKESNITSDDIFNSSWESLEESVKLSMEKLKKVMKEKFDKAKEELNRKK